MAKAKSAVPEGHHTVTPQLTLDNAAQAIDWYKKALGAEEVSRAVGPDGKIMHAELKICDSLFNRAITAGGQIAHGAMGNMQDQFWGDRSGSFTDPHGYTWTIATHKEDFTPDEMKKRSDEFMKQ